MYGLKRLSPVQAITKEPREQVQGLASSRPVWKKTWQIFQDLKFRQISKEINKFNFPSASGYSVNWSNFFSPIETE